MSASLAFQQAARGILVADSGVSALVPAANILDANFEPEAFPRVQIGEDLELPADDVVNRYTKLNSTFHIWTREPGLAVSKAIAGAVRKALVLTSWTQNDYVCIRTMLVSVRYLRDPDGQTAHGVITFESLIQDDNA
ncbi:MAG TPA: DUF3168 domain-containing protein [Candidatus Dormibacteraeota bacterium]|nr:DUF3168 domain-containing protein [Candidatus Dormibacteraeota bacterium]